MNDQYIFSRKTKYLTFALAGFGVLLLVIGIVLQGTTGQKVWANILTNNIFFLCIALSGGVFLALHKISYSGWHTSIQRIPEALTAFLPVSAFLMFMLYFGMHELYHWAHPIHDDPVLEGKMAYLNMPFFFVRMVVYFAGWIGLTYLMRKNSLLQDASTDITYHRKGKLYAALFMVFFAITISTSSWDWIMSIDAHWYSTIFGWYVFIGLLVTGIAFMILLISLLKRLGHLSFINKEHIHDMGKYLFGFSIFWMYLWFSQYLLIWYGHLPEETVYFASRLNDFKILFFLNIVVNFLFPLLALMTRNSKRNLTWLSIVAGVVIIGHWVDIFLMVMPGAVGVEAQIGFFEVGLTLIYLGGFLFVVLSSLAKAPLLSKNDPLLEESFHYET